MRGTEGSRTKGTDGSRPIGTDGSRTTVLFLKPRATIRLGAFWEFVPYNDDPAKPIPPKFYAQVRAERNKLIGNGSPGSPAGREAALEALKSIYKKQFGTRSEERNIISLFLHAGPIYSAWKTVEISSYHQSGPPRWRWCCHTRCLPGEIPASASMSSLLYTGDGFLDNHDRLALDERRENA